MSSFNYSAQPTSPSFSFFPSAPASPHAFSSFQGSSPRDQYAMYADFGSSMGGQQSACYGSGASQQTRTMSLSGSQKSSRRK